MKLKQVGGQTQRDIQQYTITVIAGTASPDVIILLHAFMEFWDFLQALTITFIMHNKIKCALQESHDHKHVIIEGGLCHGQQTNTVLHWHIPKLELTQSVTPSIEQVSSLLQWSADTTEHAHIKVVKDPASATNQNYESQICWCLDCLKKC
ncbi:hypothetical protein J3A83DRAFT_4117608 [Scleroderma citrinum]